MEKDIEVPYLQ